jgi:hypothetical protein
VGFSLNDKQYGEWQLRSELLTNVSVFLMELSFHSQLLNSNSNNNNNTANRPDIVIKNKKEKTCTLLDVAIPADRYVVQKEAEKKLKYKSLCTEI